MRVHLALALSLVCGPAMADQPAETTFSTVISASPGPYSIGRPHTCSEYYPAEALKAHAQGADLLEFVVTSDGGVKDIKITRSSGNKDLDDAAVSCVTHWRYKPATKDGVPVEVAWKANVVWNIVPPPAVQTALFCLYHRENRPAPSDLKQTAVTFRVMPDGSVSDVKIAQSSGYTVWDDAGVACAKARHFDMSVFTVPSDGLLGHLEMDWLGALASLTGSATSSNR